MAKLHPVGKQMKRRWLAIYTRPRWEKKINQVLKDRGVESYCPLNKALHKWSDRMKMVEEPLFKSYVFVHVNEEEEKNVRFVDGVLNFVYWLGQPAVIKPAEIERIKRFLNEYSHVQAIPVDIHPNDMVVINAGALMDQQAKVIAKKGNKVELEIQSLGYRLVAFVDKGHITPMRAAARKA